MAGIAAATYSANRLVKCLAYAADRAHLQGLIVALSLKNWLPVKGAKPLQSAFLLRRHASEWFYEPKPIIYHQRIGKDRRGGDVAYGEVRSRRTSFPSVVEPPVEGSTKSAAAPTSSAIYDYGWFEPEHCVPRSPPGGLNDARQRGRYFFRFGRP